MFSYKTRIGGHCFSQTTSDLLDFYTNKTEQYTDESYCILMKHHVLLAIQARLKLAKLYYFSVAMDSMAKSSQACGKRKETLKLFNVAISKYIQIYPTHFLLSYG